MSEHLEVITPSGDILFVPLDPGRGVTSIGSGAGNDLQLPLPGVPENAAVLDHRVRPYSLTAVSNGGLVRANQRALAPGESAPVQLWEGFEVGGAVVILAEDAPAGVVVAPTGDSGPAAAAAPAAPSPAAAGTRAGNGAAAPLAGAAPATMPLVTAVPVAWQTLPGNGPIERIRHDYVPLRLDSPVRMVTPGQPVVWQLTVTNGSPNVARCKVTVVGDLYASWISVSDSEFSLLERQSQTVTITLLPPRHPGSRAGEHHFAIEVRLEDVDVFLAREPAVLVIEPYYEYGVSAINPPDRSLRYGQRFADFVFTLENRGNSDVRYRIEGSDGEKATRVEFLEETAGGAAVAHFAECEIVAPPQLDPLQNTPVVMRVRPLRRKFIAAWARTYSVQTTVTPMVGTSPPSVRQVSIRHQPFTGRWIIWATVLLVAIVLLVLLRPSVRALAIDYTNPNRETMTNVSLMTSDSLVSRLGGRVRTLFGRAKTPAPSSSAPEPPPASVQMGYAPLAVGSGLVHMVLPQQRAGLIQVRDGESVTVRWQMRNGGQLVIRPTTPAGDPLVQEDNTVIIRNGSFTFTPRPFLNEDGRTLGPTIYEVVVSNALARVPVISELGIARKSFAIEVVPANAPVINVFQVNNGTPNQGESVVITWDAILQNPGDQLVLHTTSGEVSEQTVLPAATGTLVIAPSADTSFRLSAQSDAWVGGTPQPKRDVNVAVIPPTATPVPPPQIRQFDLEPQLLLQGGAITVTYNISGSDQRSLLVPGLDPSRIDLETEVGRRFIQVPVAGQVDIILEAVSLPAGLEGADPRDVPASAFATAVASRIALVPTATSTATPLPTATATPREPVIEVLTLAPVQVVLGDPVQVTLTWNVIGDADTLTIEAADFTFTTTNMRDTITVPSDKARTFVATAMRGGVARASKSVELKALEPTPTPEPPPPPTATATFTPVPPTPTPVPNPQIVSFAAVSNPVRVQPGANGEDNYFVDGGAEVRIAWEAANATGATLNVLSPTGSQNFAGRLARDEIVFTADQDNVRYTLQALNNPNNVEITSTVAGNPRYGFATRTLVVRLNPPETFMSPSNVGFTGGITETNPVKITWQYSSDQAERILGFRVYKGVPNSPDFARIANETTLSNTARNFEDTQAPTCGRVYYVVAVFQNLLLPGADKTVETNAGDASFLTPPCP